MKGRDPRPALATAMMSKLEYHPRVPTEQHDQFLHHG
jgi:hypothetical protein